MGAVVDDFVDFNGISSNGPCGFTISSTLDEAGVLCYDFKISENLNLITNLIISHIFGFYFLPKIIVKVQL